MSFENDPEADPISATFTSRRIPHGRSTGGKGKGKGKGKGQSGSSSSSSIFNPLRALGYYEVQLGPKGKSKGRGKGKDRDKHARQIEQVESESVSSWLEIHQLTEGEDGFIGTFGLTDANAGGIEGMCLLAGSRKGLQAIVDEMETETDSGEEEEDEEEDENESDDQSAKLKIQHSTHDSKVDNNSNIENNATEPATHEIPSDSIADTTSPTSSPSQSPSPSPSPSPSRSQSPHPEPEPSALELADAKLNKRHRAFEKNSFRNPKFWIRWKGVIRHSTTRTTTITTSTNLPMTSATPAPTQPKSTTETNQGYLIFANNACDRFEGTINCAELEWDNVKISGWKVRAKATECTVDWRGF